MTSTPMDCKYSYMVSRMVADLKRFADGSKTEDGDAYGAWLVMNTKDTYFGGPLHSDLTVDGILYNYISSNHHGDQTVSYSRSNIVIAG